MTLYRIVEKVNTGTLSTIDKYVFVYPTTGDVRNAYVKFNHTCLLHENEAAGTNSELHQLLRVCTKMNKLVQHVKKTVTGPDLIWQYGADSKDGSNEPPDALKHALQNLFRETPLEDKMVFWHVGFTVNLDGVPLKESNIEIKFLYRNPVQEHIRDLAFVINLHLNPAQAPEESDLHPPSAPPGTFILDKLNEFRDYALANDVRLSQLASDLLARIPAHEGNWVSQSDATSFFQFFKLGDDKKGTNILRTLDGQNKRVQWCKGAQTPFKYHYCIWGDQWHAKAVRAAAPAPVGDGDETDKGEAELEE